jgi:hypothetical protein
VIDKLWTLTLGGGSGSSSDTLYFTAGPNNETNGLKLRWGVSKAAIIFRGRQLGMFSEDQARAGYVGLNRHGEAVQESEDHLIAREEPEVIAESLKVMREHFGVPPSTVAREMRVQSGLLQTLLMTSSSVSAGNVVSFPTSGRRSVLAREPHDPEMLIKTRTRSSKRPCWRPTTGAVSHEKRHALTAMCGQRRHNTVATWHGAMRALPGVPAALIS